MSRHAESIKGFYEPMLRALARWYYRRSMDEEAEHVKLILDDLRDLSGISYASLRALLDLVNAEMSKAGWE